jgi:hypothetical protein
MKIKLAIDTGGSFTDLVSMDETGKVTLVKVESDPENPGKSIANGLDILSETFELTLQEFLERLPPAQDVGAQVLEIASRGKDHYRRYGPKNPEQERCKESH